MNNEEVLISVIVPAYNTGKSIKKTLSSLVQQTFMDFEIIVVDDGSLDDTSHIAKSFLSEYSIPYRVLQQNNKGVSATRNLGITEARGKYLFFLDHDDLVEKDCLEALCLESEGNNADFVHCQFDMIDERSLKRLKSFCKSLDTPMSGKELLKKYLLNEAIIWIGSGLYRKSIVDEIELRFPVDLILGEDIEFIARYLYHADKVVSIDRILSHYVKRTGSKIRNCGLEVLGLYQAIERLGDYITVRESEPDLIRVIEEYFIPFMFLHCFVILIDQHSPKKDITELLGRKETSHLLRSFRLREYWSFLNFAIYVLLKTILYFPSLSIWIIKMLIFTNRYFFNYRLLTITR